MEQGFDVVTGIERAVAMTGRIVEGVGHEQWRSSSPCDGWSVREVVNHVVGGMRIFAAELTGREPEADHESDWIGEDAARAFADAARTDLAAWHTDGALEGTVTISLGQLPARFAAVIHLVELVTHGVDVAVATGALHLVDEGSCEEVLALLVAMGGVDAYRVPGVFAAQVRVDPAAPAHQRLSAYLGRTVPAPRMVTAASC